MEVSANVLGYLTSVAVRALILAGAAAVGLAAWRVKSAAARHAVWTAVMGGMLVLAVAEPALPRLPVRVLKPVETGAVLAPEAPVAAADAPAAPQPVGRRNRLPRFDWRDAAVAVWGLGALVLLARFGVSYLFTRRLLGAARAIERPWASGIYESGWISVPMTAGRRILLPAEWDEWDEGKLAAVLAHERTHLRRVDWAIALAAGVNRAVFWFHPLAWWIERRLASLAEQACDDAALREVPGGPYAQALLDMAAAVQSAQGRLMWEAMAMAKQAEVKMRIERVLDETREIPREWTGRAWTALAACAVPVVWLAAATQIAPAIAQEQPKTPAAMSEYLKGRQIAPGDVAVMENYLAANPNDIQTRAQLIMYYYANGVREPRLSHIFWLIQNHPETSAALFASRGITQRDSAYNTAADYQRALELWRQAGQSENTAVVRNAAEFLGGNGAYDEAEQLLLRGKSAQPGNGSWDQALGTLYAKAILAATGDPKFANANANPGAFANRVQAELEQSNDRALVMTAASALVFAAGKAQPGDKLAPAAELGQRLMDRMGARMVIGGSPAGVGSGVNGGIVRGVPGGVQGGVPGGVVGGIGNSVRAPRMAQAEDLPAAPPALHKVDPAYPPLAMAARISGIVRFRVTIAADGTVQHIEVLNGHPLLVPNSIQALKDWTFQPPARQGDYLVEIPFDLSTVSPEAIQAAREASLGQMTSRKEATPGQPDTIRIGGNVQASKLTHRVDPVYPAQARAEGIQGSVTVQVTIAEDGTVESAEAVDGNPVLAGAAVDAAKQYTYAPTLFNGKPVKVVTQVVVPFQL